MKRQDIQQQIRSNYLAVIDHIKGKDSQQLDASENGKWSMAENCLHLVKSVAPINTAMVLPKIALRMFGTAKESDSYEDVVSRYKRALEQGAAATAPYIPRSKGNSDAADLEDKLTRFHERLIQNIENWSEADLDKFRLPHPIIGKLTVREMLFFTIYHIGHHERMMANLV